MGIIFKIKENFFVYEASHKVKLIPFIKWNQHGKDQHYVVKRLHNVDKILTKETLSKMKEVGEQYKGKSYDIYFEWSNKKIYCSK